MQIGHNRSLPGQVEARTTEEKEGGKLSLLHRLPCMTKISKVGQEDWPKSAKNSKRRVEGLVGRQRQAAAAPRRVPGRRLCQNHSCVRPRIGSHFSELSIYLSPTVCLSSHVICQAYTKKTTSIRSICRRTAAAFYSRRS